jgi:hypothetical protein
MKRFLVEKREVWTQLVAVDAENEKEAIEIASNGGGVDVDNSMEYSQDLGTETWTIWED